MEDTKDASAVLASSRAVVPAAARQFSEANARERADVAEVLATEGRRNRRGHTLRVVTAAAALIAVVALAGWGWFAWRSAATPAYVSDPVVRGDIVVKLTATGELQPTREVAVSSLVTGTIASVDVDYNQSVAKGQPLAHLDPADFETRRKRAAAAVEAQAAMRDAAAATVSDAEAALQRAERLTADNLVSDRDAELATTTLARARANLAAAEAQLKAAQADLATAESDYGKATIRSPIDGVVLSVNADPGQTITSASLVTSLFVLATDLKHLDLELDIDEADVPQIKVGDEVSFTVEAAPDKPLLGSVRQIRSAPTINDGVTSYKAIVAVDNASGTLKPGMTATADIQTNRATAMLTVSNAALRFIPKSSAARPAGQAQVYVLRDAGLVAVPITAGISDGQRSVITSGDLEVGDLVVTGLKGR